MSEKYKIRDSRQLYFVSFATVNWIDVFTRRLYNDIFVDSLRYCQRHKGLEVYAWCLMTNHAHLIISSEKDSLSAILRDLKRHTAKTILQAIQQNQQESRREWMLWMFERAGQRNSHNEQYQFWQQGNHPIELYSNELRHQRLDYLHRNPVVAGFVDAPEDFQYSSARNYAGRSGLLDVLLIQ
ncbi:REP-associated tyrosine transposase [Hymenobacter latericus]|uniref:REP-associated tyrosine transposase n=1 Tax=Hymenobacter sp. YIM 151858-1 TaxID=2987688 RepID=UPI002227F563|nr:transposase [Hymenobacter sp. YIM 151858-1]UYZ60327.1 transposase [Hymenobacter sp. YIM 151858-1]